MMEVRRLVKHKSRNLDNLQAIEVSFLPSSQISSAQRLRSDFRRSRKNTKSLLFKRLPLGQLNSASRSRPRPCSQNAFVKKKQMLANLLAERGLEGVDDDFVKKIFSLASVPIPMTPKPRNIPHPMMFADSDDEEIEMEDEISMSEIGDLVDELSKGYIRSHAHY